MTQRPRHGMEVKAHFHVSAKSTNIIEWPKNISKWRPSTGSMYDIYLDNEDWWPTKLEGAKVGCLSIRDLQIDFHLSGNDLQKLVAWNWNRHILHFIFLMEACIERFQILFKSFDSLKCWDLKLTISFHITCQGIKLKLDRCDKAIFKLHVWQ